MFWNEITKKQYDEAVKVPHEEHVDCRHLSFDKIKRSLVAEVKRKIINECYDYCRDGIYREPVENINPKSD
jgi:hypothetical protein